MWEAREAREELGRKRTTAGPKSIQAMRASEATRTGVKQGVIPFCSRFVSEMECGG